MKPRSRKSCNAARPAMLAGRRIIVSADWMNGQFARNSSRPAPISPMRPICRSRAARSGRHRYAAQYSATVKVPSARGSREKQRYRSSSWESALSSVASRDRRDHAPGEHPRHDGHDAREVGVALREVGAAVEIGPEERDRIGIARLRGEIRVCGAIRLACQIGKALEAARGRDSQAARRAAASRAQARARAWPGACWLNSMAWRDEVDRRESSRDADRAGSSNAAAPPLVCLL